MSETCRKRHAGRPYDIPELTSVNPQTQDFLDLCRSFVLQRLLQSATPQPAPSSLEPDGAQTAAPRDLLFFGCRRRDQDFLYGDQLQAWHEEGVLELHTAFSREQVCDSLEPGYQSKHSSIAPCEDWEPERQ